MHAMYVVIHSEVSDVLLFPKITIEEAPSTIYDISAVFNRSKLKNTYGFSDPVTYYDHMSDAGEMISVFIFPNG
jgi:hypothetical protein